MHDVGPGDRRGLRAGRRFTWDAPSARGQGPTPRFFADGSVAYYRVNDDQARRALRAQLAVAADIDVVGEANDGALALQLARWLRPDVALLDDDMPVMGGPELARVLAKELPEVRVVVLTTGGKTAGVRER